MVGTPRITWKLNLASLYMAITCLYMLVYASICFYSSSSRLDLRCPSPFPAVYVASSARCPRNYLHRHRLAFQVGGPVEAKQDDVLSLRCEA